MKPTTQLSPSTPGVRSRAASVPHSARPVAALAAATALALAAAGPAAALTVRVHPDSAAAGAPGYVATVVEANALVASGDSIEVSSAGSPYVHAAVMTLVDGVTYRGGFGPDFEGPNTTLYDTTIRLDAGSTDSVIDAGTAGSGTLFAGFTITGGNSSFSGGGMLCGVGTALTVRNCRFEGNHAEGVGGGVTISGSSSALIYHCDFVANTARLRGGGVSVTAGSPDARVEFCRFVACSTATQGSTTGGGGALFTASGITFTRNTVDSCWSGTDGGAILVRGATDFTCTSNWMFDNVAVRNGGTILQDGGTAGYYSLQIERGLAGDSGGGIYFQGGVSNLSGSFIRSCSAANAGGAIYYDEPSGSQVKTTEFVRNAAVTGGAIQVRGLPFSRSYSVEVISNTFAFNSATAAGAGAGIHIESGGFLDLIQNNILSHQLDGSGISCFGATTSPLVRYNCVFNVVATNPDPLYGGDCDDRTGFNGNISGNPLFCDNAADPPQLGLGTFSPCLGSGEGGADMGAHSGSGCAVISVEPMSWSRIKSYYR